MTDRELLELLVQKVSSIDEKVSGLDEKVSGLDEKVDKLDSRMDKLENQMDKLEGRMDKLEEKVDKLEEKVDNNHIEVMTKLNVLERNQGSIMRYMENADTTFRKSEETYEFIQKFKELCSKQ